MTVELLAIGAAFCFAASQVTTKLGLVHTTILGGILVSMVTAWLVLAVGVLVLKPPTVIDPTGVLLFGLAGLIAPGISRWASTVSIDRIGPSLTAPITQGTRPLIALTAAFIILGETLTATRIIGSLAIVAGGWKLSMIRKSEIEEIEGKKTPRLQLRPGLLLPVIAGVSFAASDIVVKSALGYMSEPLFGAMIGMSAALVAWFIPALALPHGRRRIRLGRDFWWIGLSGCFQGLALLSLFTALEQGDVSLVSPILASQPLAVFLLSRLFLRHLEGLELATILAGATVVAGTIVVSL